MQASYLRVTMVITLGEFFLQIHIQDDEQVASAHLLDLQFGYAHVSDGYVCTCLRVWTTYQIHH